MNDAIDRESKIYTHLNSWASFFRRLYEVVRFCSIHINAAHKRRYNAAHKGDDKYQ